MERGIAHKCWSIPLAALALAPALSGHPVPDVPVRGFFHTGGEARIEIEIDPRCFAADPLNEPYLTKESFEQLPESERESMLAQAESFAGDTVAFRFEPLGRVVPDFEFSFGGRKGADLENADDPVMITGRWTTQLTAGLSGYRVEALPAGKLSVVVINEVDATTMRRINVLFPGESSYVLDLTGLAGAPPDRPTPDAVGTEGGAGETFLGFLRQGFVHVLPLGLDHILFVLGLFLLSREWRPLLWQVTMFTLAHTLTLGLATLGGLSAPGAVVEPVIAASITVVALENVCHARYTQWRLAVVFVFGLIHGLGFAGALEELELPTTSLLIGLLGFNAGVELGQLTIIALALTATFWVKNETVHRRTLAIPGSLIIAGIGAWWTVERIFLR